MGGDSAPTPARRGHAQTKEQDHGDARQDQGKGQGDTQVVEADVPLVEMFGYATDLRSSSQGRATYSMEFGRYEQAPTSTVQAVARSA